MLLRLLQPARGLFAISGSKYCEMDVNFLTALGRTDAAAEAKRRQIIHNSYTAPTNILL